MKIQLLTLSESVLCELADGEFVEVTQIETEGEDAVFKTDTDAAIDALQAHLQERLPVFSQAELSRDSESNHSRLSQKPRGQE